MFGVTVVKHAIALSLALSCLLPATMPARAGVEDIVRANCTKQIVASTDVDRNLIKKFRVSKNGSGYVMTGQSEQNQTVTCETRDDGLVTWVRVS
jgi:hypothetical protein